MHNNWLMTRLETATFVAGVTPMAGGANVGSGHYVVLLPLHRHSHPATSRSRQKGAFETPILSGQYWSDPVQQLRCYA